MVLINLHRNLHEKSSFLSEIMFIRINPYLCHLLTRYQSTIFPNHKSCVRKKGVPDRSVIFLCSEGVGRWRFSDKGGGRGRLRLFSTPLFFREKPVIGRIGRSGRKKRVFFGPSRCVFLSGFFLFLYIFLVLVCKVFRTNPFFVFTGEAFPDLSCILLAQL